MCYVTNYRVGWILTFPKFSAAQAMLAVQTHGTIKK